MARLRTLSLLLPVLLAAAPAHAGLPLLAEDAGVLDPGACEAEAVAVSVGGVRGHALALACGTPWRAQTGAGLAWADGARALALGGKLTLWRDGEAGLALAPTLAWTDDGQGWRRAGGALLLAATTPLADGWTLHAHLGHADDGPGAPRRTPWALALELDPWAVGPLAIAPMADLSGDDRSAPWWNLGLRVTLQQERLWLGLSWARRIDPSRERQSSLNLKLAF